MRIVFLGTPEFAVPSLRSLLAGPHQVVGVMCQPDRPAGRGQQLKPPPVKSLALEVGLPVLQPEKIRREEIYAQLGDWNPDLIVVVAYGRILPNQILELPRLGCINVHASLLPKYRGAAPIQWAIYHGETHSGVTIMRVSERMDAGDILLQSAIAIGEQETYAELQDRLADVGAQTLGEAIERLTEGGLTSVPQIEAEATYAPMVKKEDGRIDWSMPAERLAYMVRAFNPWPSAYTFVAGKRLQIHAASWAAAESAKPPGTILSVEKDVAIATGNGILRAHELQLEGRKRLPAVELARGGSLAVGTTLG